MIELSMNTIVNGFGSVWNVAKPKVFFMLQLIKLQMIIGRDKKVVLDDLGEVTLQRTRQGRVKIVLTLNEDATKVIDGYKMSADVYKKLFG